MTITHHELCFGCGLANLFGLQLEVERDRPGVLSGRCFVKQDHQGPPGFAHGGIVTTALDEAMALLVHAEGVNALTRRLEVDLLAPAPIGDFLYARAEIESRTARALIVSAALEAREAGEGRAVARGRGEFAVIG